MCTYGRVKGGEGRTGDALRLRKGESKRRMELMCFVDSQEENGSEVRDGKCANDRLGFSVGLP